MKQKVVIILIFALTVIGIYLIFNPMIVLDLLD